MIEDAEKKGLLKPGRHDHRGHVGNTGMGLAIAAIVKGYKCIFTTTDKQSKEKVDALRAFGAEVIVCPTDVDPEDPRSYYSVSLAPRARDAQLVEGQPVRQPVERSGPLRDHRARDLGADRRQDRSPRGGRGHGRHHVRRGQVPQREEARDEVWGIDTYGSVFKKYKETGVFDKHEIYPYVTEGIGEDFLPRTWTSRSSTTSRR
jgi:cystathionine beta-synthase